MANQTGSTILLLGIILISTVSVPTSAQGNPSGTPLIKYNEMEDLSVDGQTYVIYRYDSIIPSVKGVTIYRDGDPVQDRGTAEKVLTAYAQSLAVAGLKQEEMRVIMNIKKTTEDIPTVVNPTIQTLNDSIEYVNGLEDREINDTSAWKVARKASPKLSNQFTGVFGRPSKMEEFQNLLRRWRNVGASVNANATTVINMLQKRQNGTSIEKDKLYRNYNDMLTSLKKLRQIGSKLEQKFPQKINTLRKIVKKSNDIQKIGDELSQRMQTLADRFQQTFKKLQHILDELTGHRETLRSVDQRAEKLVNSLSKQWNHDWIIQIKVYGVLGEIMMILAAGFLTVFTMRRE